MSVEKSYIEIFSQNRALVDKGSAGVMNSLRDAALAGLEQYGLPHSGLEEYLHTGKSLANRWVRRLQGRGEPQERETRGRSASRAARCKRDKRMSGKMENSDGWQKTYANAPVRASRISTHQHATMLCCFSWRKYPPDLLCRRQSLEWCCAMSLILFIVVFLSSSRKPILALTQC